MSNAEITAKQIASELNVNPKALRAFMRRMHADGHTLVTPVGSGNRYGITKGDATKIKTAWIKAHASASPVKAKATKATKATKAKAKAETPVVEAPAVVEIVEDTPIVEA